MIERQNYLDIRAFIDYRDRILQNDPITLRGTWSSLKRFLVWADSTPFEKAPTIKNTFPNYLLTYRDDGKDKQLVPTVVLKSCLYARLFYKWAKNEYPARYRQVPQSWIDTIVPRRSTGEQSVYKKREIWELEDVEKIASLKLERLADRRDQAAICFLYLSGMRITAFTTLPLRCVNVDNRKVEQLPEKGVITKYRKAAITSFLPIDTLLEVIQTWDTLVRESLPETAMWYPALEWGGGAFSKDVPLHKSLGGRRQSLVEGIIHLCEIAGVEYKSPHKLRHGHAVWGLKHAKTMEQMKAVSQNLMHKSIGITDSIYAILSSDDVAASLSELGSSPDQPPPGETQNADMVKQLEEILSRLRKNP